jgi:molecular chaperone DnaK
MPDEFKDKISDDDKKAIEEAVKVAEEVKSEDKDELEAATKALNDAIMPIGAKMYQAQAEEAKPEDSDKKSDKDEPVEGEVVDEK